jgi:hypothetical protein
MADVHTIEPEDPKRLRACLNALAEAAGIDACRVAFKREEGGFVIYVTCSRKTSEAQIAALVLEGLATSAELGLEGDHG